MTQLQLIQQPPLRECIETGDYRYYLSERVNNLPHRLLLWCLVNPSVANAFRADHTMVKVRGFTDSNGFSQWSIVNPYAYRATDFKDLTRARKRGVDVVGPENDEHIRRAATEAGSIVVGWGHHFNDPQREAEVLAILRATGKPLLCLGCTEGGKPRHPLMLAYNTELVPWP